MKKMVPYSIEWEKAANNAARSFCPDIYPCMKCGGPVISGFVCTRCGDSNPSSPVDPEEDKERTR
jgi:DNA-directed RNA polymerase subunit RPC12/RpoP